MSLVADETQDNVKLTVLRREGGVWDVGEISRLIRKLETDTIESFNFPEYLILLGHHSKESILEAIGGADTYTAVQVTGKHSKDLPFTPLL